MDAEWASARSAPARSCRAPSTCEVIAGAEHLPEPNWKEKKLLAKNLDRGYRLVCQLWISHDIELRQDSDEVWAATIRPADALQATGVNSAPSSLKAAP